MQPILSADSLLRPAVNVLVGSGAGPAEPELAACLGEIFPETSWRLTLHETVNAHAALSLVRGGRVHLSVLLLDRMDCAPPKQGGIGPASPLGLVRILRSAWNIPVVAIDGSPAESGRGEEILACGADCVLQRPCDLRGIRYKIEAMTSVFYSRDRLEVAADVPAYVRHHLRKWDGIAAVAFESYRRYGRVVIGVEADEADPEGAKFTAITSNPFGGWPDRRVQQMALCYDPERELVIRFTDLAGRVRTERLRAGPEGNIPKKAHKIGLLTDTLRNLRVERKMAPVG